MNPLTSFLIPLQGIAETFQISLAGILYSMSVYWGDAPDGGWMFDLSDGNTGDSIVAGIPMITGADCLAGLGYLGINGQFIVYTNGDATAVPTFTNLGTEANLYFVTDVASNV